MGLGKSLKGMIFEDEGDERDKAKKAESPDAGKKPEPTTPAGNAVPQTPMSTSTSFVSKGVVNKELLDVLRGQVDKAAPAAFSQFQTLRDTLSSVLTDPVLLVRAAFKAAESGHKMKKEELVATFEARLQILEDERQKFETGVETRRKEVVGGKEAQVSQIEDQIAELSAQLVKAQELLKTLTGEIADQSQKIVSKQQEFKLAHEALKAELTNDFTNITNYLQ